MMALAVAGKGRPKMIGAFSLPQSQQQRSRQPRRSVLPPDIRRLGCPRGGIVIGLQAASTWLYTIKVNH
jgi:hypothetical protein